jgi:hypothetical protein
MWFATWVMFAGLLLGQLGIGQGLLAATDSGEACCDCTSKSEVHDDDHHELGAHACPGDDAVEACRLGCDNCTCCPGAALAIVPSVDLSLHVWASNATAGVHPKEPPSGVLQLIYRPPTPFLS